MKKMKLSLDYDEHSRGADEEQGTEVFPLSSAVRELEMAGREDLAEILSQHLED